ncbi:type V CRISPR-associated protein Cas12k [Trichocoleus sp. ST-U2]|uniref:type V CRISPR-associated protein Cas12k n=1 Tax=Coleofasciculus sp. FACHB-SPT9 TaxID=2692791 RepID=UPI001F5577E0|nr:type V CRISPR-associated protein Cas12k [Coleofasciculus sp. FACHB-SPT9]
MSTITIQCRLVASEPTRHQLWTLMAERNTPLINELLAQISQHPDFDTWRQQARLKAGIVKQLCEPLKSDPRFSGQPGRFYTSAIALIEYIYKSWLKIQQRLQRKLEGQTRWLEMLRSDQELVQMSNCTLEVIRAKAVEILRSLASPNESTQSTKTKSKQRKKPQASNSNRSVSKALFKAYDNTEDIPIKSAICYLLKNGCKISDKEEDPEKFAQRRRKTEVKISRLTKQIASRIPKGRDLTGHTWLETLAIASTTVPKNQAEAKSWQDRLLTDSKSVPFPVGYETNEDLTWSKNSTGRLQVRFSGLSEHTFQIYCDQRQLKWFQRFYEDQEIKRASIDQHSSSLFTLRSGRIAWTESTGKGDPWNIHHLTLYCTVDTRFWTAEGTEQVRQEKAADIANTLTKMKDKGDLNEKQQAFVQRKNSTLTRLKNPFPRPSQPLYQGKPHILVGIALGLDKPATAAVIDGTTGEASAYRSIKQLLGDDHKLLNHQRHQKHSLSHERHKAQKKAASNQFGESELGEYIDRLLAQAIVKLAQTYQASSIVLPKLGDMREIVQSEIQARAEQKIPGYIEA